MVIPGKPRVVVEPPVPPVSNDPLVVFTTRVADRLLRALYRNESNGVWSRGAIGSTAGLAHAFATEMRNDGWRKETE